MGKNHRFKRQLPNRPFRVIRGGGQVNQLLGVAIHSAPHHCFRTEELEFGCPLRAGNLKLLEALFGFLLAIGQAASFKEFPRVAVGSQSTPGAGIFKWNQQQKQDRRSRHNSPQRGTVPCGAHSCPQTLKGRDDSCSKLRAN
jgi:hypothetical protein